MPTQKKEYDLNGIITVEARVKRTKETASPNQFGMYSFNKADFKTGIQRPVLMQSVPLHFLRETLLRIIKKGSSSTVNVQPYEKGRWDIIRNVINLDTNTFDFLCE